MVEMLPSSNLPSDSEDWGRAIENRLDLEQRALNKIQQRFSNAQRFTAGQLSVIGNQLTELEQRKALSVSVPDMAVTGNATSEPFPRSTKSFSFNAPPGGRVARLELSGTHPIENFGNVSLFGYLSYGGNIVCTLKWSNSAIDLETPPSEIGAGLAYVTLPNNGNVTFSVTLVRVGFTSSTSTERFEDITARLTPFRKPQ